MGLHSEHVGTNRTGIQMSPVDSKAMQEVDPAMSGVDGGDDSALAEMRNDYIANADCLGSIPLAGPLSHAAKGDSPHILLDKLGERLAFERTGTRLYYALIAKCEVMLEGDISMTIDDLEQIRADETRHFIRFVPRNLVLQGEECKGPVANCAAIRAL